MKKKKVIPKKSYSKSDNEFWVGEKCDKKNAPKMPAPRGDIEARLRMLDKLSEY